MFGKGADAQVIDLSSEPPFRVGGVVVDPASREATAKGTAERIQPQNLKVLIALAQRRGKVVSRDELICRCWDGRVIGDDVINRAISTLRQFADRVGGFRIETVPRAGYRLIEPSARTLNLAWFAAAAGALLLLAAAIHYRARPASAPPATLSVEVLPFQTSEADPGTRAISFAAHDSLSHALSQTRFEVVQPAASSHQQPAAEFLISANVSSTPALITITVQMAEAAHGVIVYSHRFSVDRANASTLADMIGPQVAGSLGWMAPMLLADRRYPSDPAIIADLFQQTDLEQVGWLSEYERTRRVALAAPNSAAAQLALASSTASNLPALPVEQRAEALAIGRAAESRTEVLAPGLGDAQMTWCLLHSRARIAECEDRLRAAMRRDPGSPWADYTLADRLKDAGRFEEALGFARHSLAADEFVPGKIALTLRLYEATGDAEDAEALYSLSHRWWPANGMIISDRIYGMMDRGDVAALVRFSDRLARDDPAEWREHLQQELAPVAMLAPLVRTHDLAAIRKACPLDQPGSFKRDLCMLAFGRVGDSADAMALALRIFPDRLGRSPADEERIFLANPFVTDSDIITGTGAAALRRDPRYVELARRIGLLAYWQKGRLPDFCRSRVPEPVCARLSARGAA